MPFYEGPETRWEHELRSTSREGLILLVKSVNSTIGYLLSVPCDHDQMLQLVRDAKKHGKALNTGKRIDRMLEDPHGEAQKWERRRRAAKKAARARKRARQANA